MGIIFITKCLFIWFSFTCEKNLVESGETSTNPNPGTQGGTSVSTPANQTRGGTTGTGGDGSSHTSSGECTGTDGDGTGTGGVGTGTDGDASTFELDVISQTHQGDNYQLATQRETNVFQIYSGKKCNIVKIGDKEVWKYDTGDYPVRVRYFGAQKRIYVEFAGGNKIYVKDGDNWILKTDGATKEGAKTGAADSVVKKETNESSSSQCGWFSCLSSGCCSK